jgi:hypothetical protein
MEGLATNLYVESRMRTGVSISSIKGAESYDL